MKAEQIGCQRRPLLTAVRRLKRLFSPAMFILIFPVMVLIHSARATPTSNLAMRVHCVFKAIRNSISF